MDAINRKNRLIGAVKEICQELGFEKYGPYIVGALSWMSEERLNRVYEILKKWVK
jgi:hypothetical protein